MSPPRYYMFNRDAIRDEWDTYVDTNFSTQPNPYIAALDYNIEQLNVGDVKDSNIDIWLKIFRLSFLNMGNSTNLDVHKEMTGSRARNLYEASTKTKLITNQIKQLMDNKDWSNFFYRESATDTRIFDEFKTVNPYVLISNNKIDKTVTGNPAHLNLTGYIYSSKLVKRYINKEMMEPYEFDLFQTTYISHTAHIIDSLGTFLYHLNSSAKTLDFFISSLNLCSFISDNKTSTSSLRGIVEDPSWMNPHLKTIDTVLNKEFEALFPIEYKAYKTLTNLGLIPHFEDIYIPKSESELLVIPEL